MVPLSEYATVSQDGTLYDAIRALRETQENRGKRRYLHRSILAYDADGKIVGKVDLLDLLRCLEPKYDEMLQNKHSYGLGFTRKFQKAMLEELGLWDAPMEKICRKAVRNIVKNFMNTHDEKEFIKAGATINEAIHALVLGQIQSLLVTEKQEIIGVLRLTDVFDAVADEVEKCEIK